MTDRKITIAIDGYSSCGKSTMAKALAKSLGYIYIDSGAMYRAVTLYSLRHGMWNQGEVDQERLAKDMPQLKVSFKRDDLGQLRTLLNDEDVEEAIRTMEVSNHVSPIAALPFVRSALTLQQQALGREKGIVMDGRDIGTTVFPFAELKIFITARPEVRAQRRFDELRSKGDMTSTLEEVLTNLKERDHIDSTRAVSPLRQADDARVLDNSELTLDQQDAVALSWARETIAQCSAPK